MPTDLYSQLTASRNKSLAELHENISRARGHSAVVVFLRHQNVAVISPVRRPRILNKPVRLTKHCTITDSQHSMVQIIRPAPCNCSQHSVTLLGHAAVSDIAPVAYTHQSYNNNNKKA